MDREFDCEKNNEIQDDIDITPKEVDEAEDVVIEFEDENVSWADEDEEIVEEHKPEFTITYTKPKKRIPKFVKIIALCLVCGIFFGAGFGFASGALKKYAMSKIEFETTDSGMRKADSGERPLNEVAEIADACMPSVVAITNHSVADVMTFFGPYSQEVTNSGSGIIIGKNDAELLIVTNYHVVANSKDLRVVFSAVESKLESRADVDDDSIPPAVVKGYDATKDLAVIAVSIENIPEDVLSGIRIATIGDSSTLRPGDKVVAIGNALGYGQSVTTGIISAVDRSITMESVDGRGTVTNKYIQTDAAINQGNSGGALLDMNGNLIGINSVKIATTGVEGMGYAIPISDVEAIIDDMMLQKTRYIVDEDKQGFLGIEGSDVTAEATQMYSIPSGVFINSVVKGLAADKAGLKEGYIITEFEGQGVTSIAQLQDRLRYYEKGEKVTVTAKIHKDGKYVEKEFSVTLGDRPKED